MRGAQSPPRVDSGVGAVARTEAVPGPLRRAVTHPPPLRLSHGSPSSRWYGDWYGWVGGTVGGTPLTRFPPSRWYGGWYSGWYGGWYGWVGGRVGGMVVQLSHGPPPPGSRFRLGATIAFHCTPVLPGCRLGDTRPPCPYFFSNASLCAAAVLHSTPKEAMPSLTLLLPPPPPPPRPSLCVRWTLCDVACDLFLLSLGNRYMDTDLPCLSNATSLAGVHARAADGLAVPKSCVVCSPAEPCLFDVLNDPSETKNLAKVKYNKIRQST